MKKEVLAYIKQNKMIKKKDMILAGVSGGSDSMAMLHILRELQEEVDFSLKVVHVHHGIRGQEADRDSRFVEKICKEWQIPCSIHYYDVPKLSREWKLGEEETGRIVRKEAFDKEISFYREKWKKENNPGNDTEDRKVKIALAHNQEDLAETMIHNLCRGTGLRGLCTMRPVAGEIIRPVLCLSRGKIARYLEQESIPHIQDSTNLSDEYTRNRIRHHILPMLEQEINAKAVAHMSETAERISQAEEYLTCQSLQILEEFRIQDIILQKNSLCSLRLSRPMHYSRRWKIWQAGGKTYPQSIMRRFLHFTKCRREEKSACPIVWRQEKTMMA